MGLGHWRLSRIAEERQGRTPPGESVEVRTYLYVLEQCCDGHSWWTKLKNGKGDLG